MKRLAIYVFYEKHGLVREYVKIYLRGLRKIAKRIIVVVNGEITENGKHQLESEIGVEIIKRPNEGVDFWAYKTGMEYVGEEIRSFDEIVLTNCSIYGPVYPFEEMFSEMGKRQVDFWGITEWPLNENGYSGTWVLSYFMVFRRRIFLSDDWKKYWANLCPVYSREECIEKHETKFTQYFADRGYDYDVYCHNTTDYIDLTIEAPDKLVCEMRCPVIKRKVFCVDYIRILSFHRGSAAKRLLKYIEENGLYDTNAIYEDLLATQHLANIKDNLHLNFFLPSNYELVEGEKEYKTAVFFHVFYEDLLDKSFEYLTAMPENADIFITSSREDLRIPVQERIKRYSLKHAEFHLVEARGRADSAFLVYDSKFIPSYDLVCIAHDKKSSFLHPGCIGIDFGLHNLDSLLKSKQYVKNVISVFQNNKRIGILEPMNLVHGNFTTLAGQEWGANYDGVADFLHRAGIDLPIAPDVPPVAPMGAMFWFRPDALIKLLNMDWEYTDFPKEPMPLDGAIIHIVERAIPFFAQDAGYLTGWISSIEDAEVHLTNVAYRYRQANMRASQTVVVEKDGQIVYVPTPVPAQIGVKGALKIYLKKHMPTRLWNFCKRIYYKLGGKPI